MQKRSESYTLVLILGVFALTFTFKSIYEDALKKWILQQLTRWGYGDAAAALMSGIAELVPTITLACVIVWGLHWYIARQHRRDDPTQPRADFRVSPFNICRAERVVATTTAGGTFETRNPVVILLRIDNVGTVASSLSEFRLSALVDGVVHWARSHAIVAPMHFEGLPTVSPASALYERAATAIPPGHSVAGALFFSFDDVDVRTTGPNAYTLHFEDIYLNQYSVALTFAHPTLAPMAFPGINYDRL